MLYNYFTLIVSIDYKELCNYSGTQILLLKIILSFALSKLKELNVTLDNSHHNWYTFIRFINIIRTKPIPSNIIPVNEYIIITYNIFIDWHNV